MSVEIPDEYGEIPDRATIEEARSKLEQIASSLTEVDAIEDKDLKDKIRAEIEEQQKTVAGELEDMKSKLVTSHEKAVDDLGKVDQLEQELVESGLNEIDFSEEQESKRQEVAELEERMQMIEEALSI
jgi:hypothetical protein